MMPSSVDRSWNLNGKVQDSKPANHIFWFNYGKNPSFRGLLQHFSLIV